MLHHVHATVANAEQCCLGVSGVRHLPSLSHEGPTGCWFTGDNRIVGFDLLAIKLAFDSVEHVSNLSAMTAVVRIITISAWVAMTGMLIQIELRNRLDRAKYRWAEDRAIALRTGATPPAIPVNDSFWRTIRASWAGTWPVLGGIGLTVALWCLAGLIDVSVPPVTSPK